MFFKIITKTVSWTEWAVSKEELNTWLQKRKIKVVRVVPLVRH